jgi:NAD(P)-dependent dehydrogenase (short-subunit alcohol dehydrogenase family)
VNSAGIGSDIPLLETPLEALDQIVDANLRGTFIGGGRLAVLSSNQEYE